jgi:hypothetical protein
MSADELTHYNPGPREEFIKNQLTEASHLTLLTNFWEKAYKYIYTANLCIEKLAESSTISSAVKNRLTGECKFIRAFCYFHLVNLFGDVPLLTTSDYAVNAVSPRTSLETVYSQITTDLTASQSLLSADYPTTGRVRPNKWTATALLARVYLYRKDWANAELQANAVIGAGMYSLEQNLSNVFLLSSNEAIWQLLPVNFTNNSTWEGSLIIPVSPVVTPTYLLTDTLIKSFETDDRRKTNWTMSRVFNGQTLYYPVKYKVKTAAVLTEYYSVFRLAEQYLVRAEASAQLNKLSAAAGDINTIRNRAGLPNTTAVSQPDLLSAIEQERKMELFAEWGHRWYDLKRTGRADAVIGGLKPLTWKPTDALWPIPVSQLNLNPALTQNPGY